MVEIKNDNNYAIGDKVWWFDSWGNLCNGVVYDFYEEKNKKGGPVNGLLIHENGRPGSCTGAEVKKCWPTEEACLEAEKKRSKLQTEEYKGSIKTVTDLVQFLYEHDVRSENRDTDAQDAAVQRAMELLHIDLEKRRLCGKVKEQNKPDEEYNFDAGV